LTPSDIIEAALADGVTMHIGPAGLHLSGERSAVTRWVSAVRSIRDDLMDLLQPDPRCKELRRLLTALLWDAPEEVEPEVQRAIQDDAVAATLVMYRRCYEDYQRIGELITRKTP